jgi:PIN domain nuclease of toxin-antitoxin system
MTGLLDTHTFIWWDSDPDQLSATALAFLQDPANTVLLSVVSPWEMLIKQQLGKLTLRLPLQQILAQQQANGIQILPVRLEHVLAVEGLPTPHNDPFDRLLAAHNDPFDRLLAAQAKVESVALVSADPIFAQYPVQVLW